MSHNRRKYCDEEYEFVKAEYWRDEKGKVHSALITLRKGNVIIKDAFMGISAYLVNKMGFKEGDIIVGYLSMMDILTWKIDVKREKRLEYLGELKHLAVGEIVGAYYEISWGERYISYKIDCGSVYLWDTWELEDDEYGRKGYKNGQEIEDCEEFGDYILQFGRLDFEVAREQR